MSIKISATLLNLIAPGAGLALQGHIRKAWLCYLLFLLMLAWATLERWLLQLEGWLCTATALALIGGLSIIWGLCVDSETTRPTGNAWHAGGLGLTGLVLLAGALHYRAEVLGLQFYFIPSPSMTPTLLPGDFILVDTWAYRENPPAAGDIVVFEQRDGLFVIKRCANWPGDTKILHNDQLYVLGDNPQASLDSRRVGGIDLQRVKGQALYRVAHWDPASGHTHWPLQALAHKPIQR